MPEIGDVVLFKRTPDDEFEEGTTSALIFAPAAIEVIDMKGKRLTIRPPYFKPLDALLPTTHGAIDSAAALPPPEAAARPALWCPFCAPENDIEMDPSTHQLDNGRTIEGVDCPRCDFSLQGKDSVTIEIAHQTLWDYLDAAEPNMALGA